MFAEIAAKRLARLELVKAEDKPTLDLSAYKDDFLGFCELLDIIDKEGKRVKFKLNPIQKLFNENRTGRDVVLKPRQVGLTTEEDARDLWALLCTDGARVVIVCQSISGGGPAKLISGVIRLMIESLQEAGAGIRFQTEAWNEWTLPNGNSLRITVAGASEASASKKGRAGTITRLHLTETAFYEYADITLNALLECVPHRSTGSEIVSESTPNGASGYFYRSCKDSEQKKGGHRFHFFSWFHHPEYQTKLDADEEFVATGEDETRLSALGCTAEQLKWRRDKIVEKGLDLFNQEYPENSEICFLISGRGFFDEDATKKLVQEVRTPIEIRDRDRIRIFAPPRPGAVYLLSLDTAEGGGGDPSGGLLTDYETGEHVATVDGQYIPWDLAAAGVKLAIEYNRAFVVPERNNHGHAVIQAMVHEHKYGRIYRHTDKKLGWLTNAVTRPTMLDALDDAHRKGLWRSPDLGILTQFRCFVVNKNGKPEAASGERDDLVMAAAINWAVRQQPRRKQPPGGLLSVNNSER